jgi:3-oxoacyl-(acyl-carrier-protein) synthase
MGTINALGPDTATFWRRLVDGGCGIARLGEPFENPDGLVAAAVPDPLPGEPSGPGHTRTERLAGVAAEEAVRASGLPSRYSPRRIAIVVGTTTGGEREVESAFTGLLSGRRGPRSVWFRHDKASVADVLGSHFGFSGARFTLNTACASGASAIALAADLIHVGLADAALCGGADSLARVPISGFRALRALDPSPCRPFDRSRRGMSIGEGAGFLVLERLPAAESAGVEIVSHLLSCGQSTDAHHVTAPLPDGSGQARAIAAALEEAALRPEQVDHINAHGTGTPANDAAEARAIRDTLGAHARRCPVTSIKGSIGHTLGAAGGIEAIATIETLRRGIVPPTVGLSEPDPEIGLDLVRNEARGGAFRVALSHSFGFGGGNAVLCFGRRAA